MGKYKGVKKKGKPSTPASGRALHNLFPVAGPTPEEEEWFNWAAESIADDKFIAHLHKQLISRIFSFSYLLSLLLILNSEEEYSAI